MGKKQPKTPESSPSSSTPAPQVEKDNSESRSLTLTLGVRPDLPTVWFDSFRMARRSDVEIVVFSFFHKLPFEESSDQLELFRAATTTDHVRKIIDMMCRNLDYYPVKEAAKA